VSKIPEAVPKDKGLSKLMKVSVVTMLGIGGAVFGGILFALPGGPLYLLPGAITFGVGGALFGLYVIRHPDGDQSNTGNNKGGSTR
jgi:hypothetical protein